ncbi:cytochrome c oxidase subunit NDUFA4-like [Crotalus tigris]|uniref:cytochrome c oxidase subunit NDUFA4-like n=1 Tax=Crotalus tigris TaxID=88082 RepID=UPI00192F8FEC|nr:cytochrome c oxidase subunit NDUFA4-like [Crotalus tigris]
MRRAGGTNCCSFKSPAVQPKGIPKAPQLGSRRKDAPSRNMPLRLRQITRVPTLSLILITGFGFVGGFYILARKTFFIPEVSWEKTNQESWNNRGPSDQYKLFAMTMDSKDPKKDRPDC